MLFSKGFMECLPKMYHPALNGGVYGDKAWAEQNLIIRVVVRTLMGCNKHQVSCLIESLTRILGNI